MRRTRTCCDGPVTGPGPSAGQRGLSDGSDHRQSSPETGQSSSSSHTHRHAGCSRPPVSAAGGAGGEPGLATAAAADESGLREKGGTAD